MQTELYQQFQFALNSHLRIDEISILRFIIPLVIVWVAIAFLNKFLRIVWRNVTLVKKKNSKAAQNIPNALIASHSKVALSPLDIDNSHARKYQIGKYMVQTSSFSLHKNGGSQSEYEDRSAIGCQGLSCLRVAVADGTTESLFSDVWAELLVNDYINKGIELFDHSNLEAIHKDFIQQTYQRIAEMPEIRHWAMYEKLERGTHATLAAIEFSTDNTVHLSAVGDSCIFWFDENNIEMLPELHTEDFGISPDSICHIPKTWHNLRQKVITREIEFNQSILFVLCTDALACWLAKETREKNNLSAWEEIIQLSDIAAFNQLIEKLRESKEIRNDDTTLVIVNATLNV